MANVVIAYAAGARCLLSWLNETAREINSLPQTSRVFVFFAHKHSVLKKIQFSNSFCNNDLRCKSRENVS